MGLSGSKIGKQISVEENIQEGSLPSTPILTPISCRKNDLLDPRSPSTNIARTPLELLDDELSEENETPVKNYTIYETILGIDPRSPTTDFVRTPIILNEGGDLPEKIKNKNLEKVLRSEIYTPLKCKNDTPSFVRQPKLLESSPIKSRSEAYKRKSFVGLLETNIDFTETDLDVVIKEKTKAKEIASPSRISIVETENVDPRSPTTEFLRTPIQIIKKIGEIELNGTETDSVIDRDSTKNKEVAKQEIQAEEMIQTKEVEELQFYDKTEIDTLEHIDSFNNSDSDVEAPVSYTKSASGSPTNNVVIPASGSKSVPVTPPLVNLTADVKELDKKLSNLIYEDRDIIVCPRIVKLKDVTERSPLRSRNIIESDKKPIHKLKVSDKPRKSDFSVSKIPLYKNKGERIKKVKVQCENTPPRCIERKKVPRKSHWDNTDNTLYL